MTTAIGNIIFEDLNGNGIQDAGEPGMAGVKVILYNAAGDEIDNTTSDNNGTYLFPNIAEGDYYIVVEMPEDYKASPKDQGTDDTVDSDIDENGQTEVFSIPADEVNLNMDAGLVTIACDPKLFASFAIKCDTAVKLHYIYLFVENGISPYHVLAEGIFDGPYENLPPAPEGGNARLLGPFIDEQFVEVTVTDADGCLAGEYADNIPCGGIVPIELLNFSGEVQQAGNLLKWTTLTEINNSHFNLMRSVDGTNFVKITTVQGAGNSNKAIDYSFMDYDAPDGLSYYRLDQYDLDGSGSSSNVITLIRNKVQFELIDIVPVPTTDYIDIRFNTVNDAPVLAKIYDIAGRLISDIRFDTQTGINKQRIDVRHYAAGTYIISLNDGYSIVTNKFVKE